MHVDKGKIDFNRPDLPTPPTDKEKYSYVKANVFWLAVTSSFLISGFFFGSYLFLNDKPWVYQLYWIFVSIICVGGAWNVFAYLTIKPFDTYWWDCNRKWCYK